VSWYLIPASVDDSPDYGKLRQRLTGGYRFSPLESPARKELYGQREDISVPTVEVWESSERIESKLDELGEEQKRQHRTVKWMLAALAALIIVGIVWSPWHRHLLQIQRCCASNLKRKLNKLFSEAQS
jgi:hypothetical protein